MNSALHRWATALALAGLAAGCDRQNAAPSSAAHPLPTPPQVAACEPGVPGGQLVLPLSAPPRTFHPSYATDAASDQITRLLFAGLVQYDFAKQDVAPGLAEAWAASSDGKTWTFTLRRGLHWSDGHPLTVADVLFTWNDVIYNPRLKSPLAGVFRVGGRNFAVTAPDEQTIRVVTVEVFAPFLEFFGTVPVLPKHALADAVKQGKFANAYAPGTPPNHVVGAGPFRLKEHQPGQFTVLERNPEFWMTDRADRRLPYLDTIRFNVAPANAPTGVAALLGGQGDVAERVRGADFAVAQTAAAQGRLRLIELGPSAERDFLWFNQNTNVNRISGVPFVATHKLAWFRDTRFRQAVSCALDRQRIVREVFAGRAVPCETYLGPETLRWNNPDVPRYGFDRGRAKALLAQAGLQDRNGDGVAEDAEGRPAEIILLTNTGNPIREQVAARLADDLRQIGLRLKVELIPYPALDRKMNVEFTYEAVLMGLSGGGADPAAHINVLHSADPMHQWFPSEPAPSTPWEARMDELMDAQMRTLDFAARKKSFDEVQAILAEQLPMIYTVAPVLHAAARPDLQNLRPAPLSPYALTWNAEELWLKAK